MSRTRGLARCALLALGCAGLAAARLHPLHTTLTQLSAEHGTATLWVRAFADDFATGVAGAPRRARADAAAAYLQAAVRLWDRSGRPVALRGCGVRRTQGLLWMCLRGAVPTLRGARVLVSLQFAVYDDQVNLVQARYEGETRSLLFVPGDAARALR